MKNTLELAEVTPWGRSMAEYLEIFSLTEKDLSKRILSVGDGTSSFNSEMFDAGRKVVSADPIYKFNKLELNSRIDQVMAQASSRYGHYSTQHPELKDYELKRFKAMKLFIKDYDNGKKQKRYLNYALPDGLKFKPLEFELGLSAHFLLLYDQLGLEFHITSITALLSVCKEVRIFPTLNLRGQRSTVLNPILEHFNIGYSAQLTKVAYGFEQMGFDMLTIKRKHDL